MPRRYLLDSGPAQDFAFRRRGIDDRVKQARSRGISVGLGAPVLGEVIGGILYGDSHEASWKKAKPMLMSLVLWPFDASAAQEYGRLFAGLKSIGRPMQQIDIQIAAIALALGNCTVITYDSDLAAVPGLAIENWRA